MASSGGNHSLSGPSSTDGNQVAASNSTVNAFLGGRQPSWMTNTKPVRPTPRPPRPVNLPPKSPSRPELPHLPMQQARQSRLSQQQAHPPRETQHQSPVVQVAAPLPPQPPHQPPQPLPTTLSQAATTSSNFFAVLPSPAPSDEPSPALSISYEATSPDRNRSLPPETTGLAPRTEALFAPNLSQNGDNGITTLSGPSRTTITNGSTTPGETQVRPTSRAPTPTTAMTLQTPPTPSVPSFGSLTAPMSEVLIGNQYPPAKRRRTGRSMPNPVLDALQATTAIDSHIAYNGGEQCLDSFVERPRYQLLRDACQEGDLFFVALHQLFCVWSNNNSEAHKFCIEDLHDTNLVDNAFGLMGTILKSNSKIRPEHLHWFMIFPGHLHQLCGGGYPDYAKAVHRVLDFLVRLSHHWMVMNHNHRKLQYPLLMDELLGIFRLYSPILQSIIFRASRRTLGVADGPIGTWMDEVFKQDQLAHRDANGNFFTRATSDYQNEPTNQVLIQRYQSAVIQQQQQQQQLARDRSAAVQQHQNQQHQHQQHQRHQQHQQTQQTRQQQTFSTLPQMNDQVAQATNTYAAGSIPGIAPTRTPVAPVVPSNEPASNGTYTASSPTTSSWVAMSSTENDNFLSATPATYQFPSAQLPVLQSNINSPTNAQFPNTPPVQSPIMNQGQFAPSKGQSETHTGGHSVGGAVLPSQPLHRGYPQHQAIPRHASQQFAQMAGIPSTLSPRMQYLAGLPSQMPSGRNSPSSIQNMVTQLPQAPFSGPSSPNPHNVAQRSTQSQSCRVSTTSASPAPQNHLNNLQAPTQAQLQQMRLMQQQQQHIQEQLMNHVRQSVGPQPMASRPNQQYQRTSTNTTPVPLNRINRFPPVPPSEYPHDPYERKSLDSSLHQAHLRSPKRIPKPIGSSFKTTEKHYQCIKYLAMPPTPIPQQHYLHTLKFNLSAEIYSKISPDVLLHRDSLPVNLYSDGSLRVRLRCCFTEERTTSISEGSWVLLDTTWPEHIYMQLNDKTLTVKRKQHHHKDQPVEIGFYVKPGENTLKLNVPFSKPIPNNMKALIAVEVIETLAHGSIRGLPNLAVDSWTPSAETRATIQKRLAGSSRNCDDDEIAMVVSDLTVNLADPFSYSIYNIPVRGKDCTHLECFDLETWLETRPTKKHCVCGDKLSNCTYCPREPSLTDKWKCPICQGDARPYSLRIDGFLLEVREALGAQGLLKTKAIVVSADGSWRPIVPDDDSDVDSDDDNAPSTTAPRPVANPVQPRVPIQVITLEDD